MVHDYSRRDLTKGTDKLPAFAGLARLFKQMAVRESAASRRYSPDDEEQHQIPEPSQYVFGLWKDLMVADLLWYVDSELHPQRPTPDRAPSWSWASLDSVIFNDLVHFQHGSSGLEILGIGDDIRDNNSESDYGSDYGSGDKSGDDGEDSVSGSRSSVTNLGISMPAAKLTVRGVLRKAR
jgi:hypothetical protein